MKNNPRVRRTYLILLFSMAVCLGCQWHLRPANDAVDERRVSIVRYDRIEHLYLTTADFAALQQMKTAYPMQTRMLIEDVLKLGRVDESDINTRFLMFFQDSTLQALMRDVERQYASTDDLDDLLTESFGRLRDMLPSIELPSVYTQIGSLDQSVVVGNNSIGICLDKYLGTNFSLYKRPDYGYSDEQRRMMDRKYIVPDCIGFYLLSLYPMPLDSGMTQKERDIYIGKIQWVVDEAMGEEVFASRFTRMAGRYMKRNKNATVDQLLRNNDFKDFY